jgi:hypothetical protein
MTNSLDVGLVGTFVGDDETDEDVFRRRDERVIGVRVGTLLRSEARFLLRGQEQVGLLVDELVAAEEGLRGPR